MVQQILKTGLVQDINIEEVKRMIKRETFTVSIITIICFIFCFAENIMAKTSREENLLSQLSAKEDKDRKMAKRELISLGDKVLPTLQKHLKGDNWLIRYEIAEILGNIKTKGATEMLIGLALNRDERESTRILAVKGLKDRELKPNIIVSLLRDENFHIRYETIHMIKEDIEDKELIDTLKENLFTEQEWRIKVDIVQLISKLQKLDSETKVKSILTLLKEEYKNPTSTIKRDEGFVASESIKRDYIHSLTLVGQSAIPILKKEKEKEISEIKEVIIVVLGQLRDEEVFSDLLKLAIDSKESYIRELSVRSLGDYENKSAIPVLKKALKDNYFTKSLPPDCRVPEGYEWSDVFYPVRIQSFFALKKLGVKIREKPLEPGQINEYIIEE